MQARPPVLVTGSHRSGSTFVGKMLAVSPSLGYIREPFSVLHRPGILDVRFPHWFPYICAENQGPYVRPIRDMLAFRYRASAGVRAVRSLRDVGLVGHDLREFARFRRRHARPLLKDPIAVFSAEWLCDAVGAQPVVLIRHPAAFASSIIRYGWRHPFEDFLAQPLLMRDLLSPFQDEIARFAATEQELIDQAILLWNLIHHAIAHYQETRPDWRFFRHEDIAREPIERFAEMFGYLGVGFGERERTAVAESTAATNPSESNRAGELKRDSRSAAETWKARLPPEQIAHIREGTEAIASRFYEAEDW